MNMCLYTIRDVVSNIYGTPFASVNDGSALRSVAMEVNGDRQSVLAANPADFEVYSLGSFNQDTARFELFDAPVLLVRCSALLADAISAAGTNCAGTVVSDISAVEA